MNIVYHYQVTYVDYAGRTHLHFSQNKEDVKRICDNYSVKEVVPTYFAPKFSSDYR